MMVTLGIVVYWEWSFLQELWSLLLKLGRFLEANWYLAIPIVVPVLVVLLVLVAFVMRYKRVDSS